MALAWKGNTENQRHTENKNDGASFQKHNEYMRRFRLAHPRVETRETTYNSITFWLTLSPVPMVMLNRYSSN